MSTAIRPFGTTRAYGNTRPYGPTLMPRSYGTSRSYVELARDPDSLMEPRRHPAPESHLAE